MKLTRFGELDARITGGVDREGSGDGPVVVLLHGFGAPGDDLVPLWRSLGAPAGTRFVFPEAPIDLGPSAMGGRAWWPLDLEEHMRRQALGQRRDTSAVPAGVDVARAKIDALLDGVERTLQPPPGKLVLGGFSQGAMVALDATLHSSRALAGLVLLSGSLIAAGEWATRYESRRGLPTFMSHGQQDEILPFAISEELRDLLTSHGIPVEWLPFRGGHGVPPSVVGAVAAFLNRVLA
jgi:phospholipase/carboxylesterase